MKNSAQKTVFSMTNPTISRNAGPGNAPAIVHPSNTAPLNNKTLAQNLMKGWLLLNCSSICSFIFLVTDPKHVPKDFRDQFLKKLQMCSAPLDFNDEHRQQKEKVYRYLSFSLNNSGKRQKDWFVFKSWLKS